MLLLLRLGRAVDEITIFERSEHVQNAESQFDLHKLHSAGT